AFGRNSIDDAGMTMMSSIHFGKGYNNAMWNGTQMIYGDGDGKLFTDFTAGDDVIGHELTHGVTQHSLHLAYTGDAGGLTACVTHGGKSWERIGQVWYAVLTTSGANPNMAMPKFAARCRQIASQMYPKDPAVGAAIDAGWKKVGL